MKTERKLKFIILYWEDERYGEVSKTIVDAGEHPNLHYQEYTTHRVNDHQTITEWVHRREVSWYKTEAVSGKGKRQNNLPADSNPGLRQEDTRTGYSDQGSGDYPDPVPQ